MKKEDIIVAIHGRSQDTGGRYKALSSFRDCLLKAFNAIGVKALTTEECVKTNTVPHIAIAMAVSGLPLWQKFLNNNVTNIMWGMDSVFYQNTEIVKQFSNYKNFIFFNPCSADTVPIGQYFPNLVHGYIPGGTDLDFWKKEDIERDLDITFFGSIDDPEVLIQKLKDTMPHLVFNLMMNFVDIAIANPTLSLWDIYQYLKKETGLDFDLDQYHLISKSISYIITYKQRIKMIQSLKDFNLTVFGEGPWEKFTSGKIKVVSGGNVNETVHLMKRSKITLQSHPFHLAGGIHDRVLNASAVATPVLCAQEKTCIAEFKNNIIYCNPVTYEDIADKASYYLSNKEEREFIANSAYEIVKSRHKWSDRAKSIMNIVDVN